MLKPIFHDTPFDLGPILDRAISAATKPDGSIDDLDAVEIAFDAIAASVQRNDIFKLMIIEALRVRVVAKLEGIGLVPRDHRPLPKPTPLGR